MGEHLHPTLTLVSDGQPDEIDLGHVAAWDFKLVWDDPALDFHQDGSTLAFAGATYTLPELFALLGGVAVFESAGSYAFSWLDSGVDGIDLGDGFVFTADFTSAVAGAYAIGYGPGFAPSSLLDTDFNQFDYSGAGMRAEVLAPVPLPASGLLVLLTAGLVALSAAARRAWPGKRRSGA